MHCFVALVVISASLRTTSSPLSNFRPSRRNSTRADLSLGRWPATNTCFFSRRTAYTIPSLALRRAGLPSCASQLKSDGHQLPCGGPLPEHGTATRNYFASKKKHGLRRFRFPKGHNPLLYVWFPVPACRMAVSVRHPPIHVRKADPRRGHCLLCNTCLLYTSPSPRD